jgi:hypothetical protein
MLFSPEDAAKNLAWEVESWKSIELKVRHDYSLQANSERGDHAATSTLIQHYIQTAKGERLAELLTLVPGTQNRAYASYTDGKSCVDITFEADFNSPQKQFVYKKVFADEGRSVTSQIPPPLRYFFLEQKPLHEQLIKGSSLGLVRMLGRDCERILLPHVKWTRIPVDIVYCLDKETGIPLSVSCYPDQDSLARSQPIWTWEAVTFDTVGTHRFPLKSTEVTFVRGKSDGAPSATVHSTRNLTVEEIAFDKDFEKSTFKPVPAPGVTVWDQVAQKTYMVPEGRQKGDSSASAGSVASNSPVVAPGSYYFTFGIILSLSLAVAASAIMWRKSQKSKPSGRNSAL